MNRIQVKALSINEAFMGRRFKTDKHKNYEKEVILLLPNKIDFDFSGKIALLLEFGLSSKNADLDNCVKVFIDCLQKKYLFNDKQIYKLDLEKWDVKKGQEYIRFKFKKYNGE